MKLKVASLSLDSATVPEIELVPSINIYDEVLIVAGFIFSLNVAVIILFRGTFTASSAGSVSITRGQIPIISPS